MMRLTNKFIRRYIYIFPFFFRPPSPPTVLLKGRGDFLVITCTGGGLSVVVGYRWCWVRFRFRGFRLTSGTLKPEYLARGCPNCLPAIPLVRCLYAAHALVDVWGNTLATVGAEKVAEFCLSGCASYYVSIWFRLGYSNTGWWWCTGALPSVNFRRSLESQKLGSFEADGSPPRKPIGTM